MADNGKIITADLSKLSANQERYGTPTATIERLLSEVLAGIMSIEKVPVDSNFFEDLGADSMVMARFCARLRKQTDLPPVPIKKAYKHPTISSLAATLAANSPLATTERLLSQTLAEIMSLERVPLDSNFFEDLGADSMVMTRFCARLRKQTNLPRISIKQVYEHPTISSLATALTAPAPPPTEQLLAQVLADVMSVDKVSADSNFFEDLGADSMIMARFCARLRKQTDLPPVPIKQVYAHPTITSLAAALNGATSTPTPAPAASPPVARVEPAPPSPGSTPSYLLCGTLQILSILAYFHLFETVLIQGSNWITAAPNFSTLLIRGVVVGNGIFLGMTTLPILAKWLLIGRWKPQQFPVWSLSYFRFWLVKTLVSLNPLALFAGSPIFILYLRALGAKIGRNVVILSPNVPGCPDLLTVGDNTVIRKDAIFNCYRANAGMIQTGSVTIGKDAFVGEMTVLDIETSMGHGAQLGHSSSLNAGQSIPDGEHRHGSPARKKTNVDYRDVDPIRISLFRKVVFSAGQLLNWFFFSSIFFSVLVAVVSFVAEREYFALPEAPGFSQWIFYIDALLISFVIFFGSILLRLIVVVTIPRLFNRALKPNRVYPLYGFHYWLQGVIARMTNVKFFNHLFGDSSYIVNYLRWIGYDLSEGVVQTGSNFGMAVKHDNPFLVSIGRGTMIADGLSMINAKYSNSSFRLSPVEIGPNNFLGNFIAYSAQGKTGDNCLLATKVMVPMDGDIREGVGLLGSPSFEIPRSVKRDSELAHPKNDEEFSRQLAAKNRYNLVTMGLFLFVEWSAYFGTILLAFSAAKLYQMLGVAVIELAILLNLVLRILYQGLVERSLSKSLQTQECSIYEPYFWFHERFWKLSLRAPQMALFNGTPIKSLAWRLLGVRIGRRVFDDGAFISDRTLVAIGDDCTLNAGTLFQSHSQEDGGFKTGRISIGAGCTIGVGTLVHYGVIMGDGVRVASGSFVMKGEEIPPHTHWGENPAMEVQDTRFVGVAMTTEEQPRFGEKLIKQAA